MQLSDVLERLSAEERKIMYERRHVPEQGRSTAKAASVFLAHPTSVAMALSEVNAAQMRLLEWLAARPGLTASWRELTDAVGESINAELLESYVTDLRLLALADGHPTLSGGFIATYPAAVAMLPQSRRQPVQERLAALTSDVLLRVCSALGVRKMPSRKDQRIEAILQIVTDSEACRSLVGSLSSAAQALFSWMIERHGSVALAEMQERVVRPKASRHGSPAWTMEAIWVTPGKGQLDPLSELMRCALVLPVSVSPWYPPTSFVVPGEILRTFTGQGFFAGSAQVPPRLDRVEVTTQTVPNPSHLLRDIGHLLGFVNSGRCEWRQDGQPYKRSLVAFGKLIENKDHAYADFLWSLCVQVGLITRLPSRPPDYSTVYEVRPTSEFSPERLLTLLVAGWVSAGEIAFHRAGLGYMQDNPSMRLLLFVRTLPPDTWVLKSALVAWLRFTWPLTFAPEVLGLGSEPAAVAWSSLEWLVLGHGTTADGAEAVMLPTVQQQLVSLRSDVDPDGAILPPWEDQWVAQPDRTIIAPPNLQTDALVNLWRVADLESNQGAAVFRVSVASIAGALNRGMTPDEIRAALISGSRTPLPPTITRLIDDQSERYGRVKVGAAQTFVQTDDPALMSELRRHAKLKNLTWHEVAPGVAFVLGSGPDAVMDAMKKAGYLPVRAEADRQPGRGSAAPAGGTPGAAAPVSVKALKRVVNRAIRDDDDLKMTWIEGGRTVSEDVTPIDLHESEVHIARGDGTRESEIPFAAITAIEIAPYLGEFDVMFDLEEDS